MTRDHELNLVKEVATLSHTMRLDMHISTSWPGGGKMTVVCSPARYVNNKLNYPYNDDNDYEGNDAPDV